MPFEDQGRVQGQGQEEGQKKEEVQLPGVGRPRHGQLVTSTRLQRRLALRGPPSLGPELHRFDISGEAAACVSPDCLFCGLSRALSSQHDSDEHTVAFMDINPATRGHALVVPREHSADLMEISPQTVANQMASALTTLRELLSAHLKER
jgi:hypothetical protein